jgi:hypothetical protein
MYASTTVTVPSYYQALNEADAARAKNSDMPEPEPDDYMERIYVDELRRLEALEK